jgi:transposase
MYIDIVPNRGAAPTVLLRESYRDGKAVRKRTLANLTHLPPDALEAVRQCLKGEKLVPAASRLAVQRSRPHGHVKAILGVLRKLGLDRLIDARRTRQRDLVLAMITERLLHGASKLASTRLWHTTTLAEELDVQQADEDDLYEAMDWLLARQQRIEKKLAARHLDEGAQVLYDVTSSYYEGRTCPLARHGHNRDGKKGKLIIVYGVLTDADGRPIAVDVYPGNTGDSTTVPDQVDKLRERFGLARVVLVGDRGMLTQTQIDKLKAHPQLGWISALRSASIRQLVEKRDLEMSLFDDQQLAEIRSPEFPGERLIACYNPILAAERARKREELVVATEKKLAPIAAEVARRKRKPLAKEKIALKVGKVLGRFKVGKHFTLTIDDGRFEWARNEARIRQEAALDGIYVIRTSEPAARLSAEDTVRSYKNLAQVERAFRSLKGIDIRVRPIRHRDELRVRAHIFLCLLAYYVEWHMREALRPLLFDDEELSADRQTRDPVAPAEPSASAKRKKAKRKTADGHTVHSFETLLEELGGLSRSYCRIPGDPSNVTFTQDNDPTPLQAKAYELLGL